MWNGISTKNASKHDSQNHDHKMANHRDLVPSLDYEQYGR